VKKTTFRLSIGFFLIALFLLPGLKPISLGAFDFGLITNQYAAYGHKGTTGENASTENDVTYQADILPRLSFLIGNSGEFFLSAGLTLGYEDQFYYVPELLRTEMALRFGSSGIRFGRIPYADPLSFIASGLFDGAQFYHNSKAGIFSIGAWYTGLLYKKTAYITMTQKDQALYDDALNYGDFSGTYFAPPRLLASLDWEHPSIAELFSLKIAATGQVDLSAGEEKYHSQYLTLKVGIPVQSFLFELGGSAQASQSTLSAENENNQFAMAYAWSFGIFWTLPTRFSSQLSLTGNFAGGRTDDFLRAFVPITTKTFGNILEAKLTGLSVVELNYTARVAEAFGTSLQAMCFVRNDLGTYKGYPLDGDDKGGYILGTEIFARMVWSPVSDLQLNLGGGAFLPSLGNASDANPMWRVELTAILALF